MRTRSARSASVVAGVAALLVVLGPLGASCEPTDSFDGTCDPNYSGCVPSYPPDVDCGAVGGSVEVYGADPHGLDGDGDGIGCE